MTHTRKKKKENVRRARTHKHSTHKHKHTKKNNKNETVDGMIDRSEIGSIGSEIDRSASHLRPRPFHFRSSLSEFLLFFVVCIYFEFRVSSCLAFHHRKSRKEKELITCHRCSLLRDSPAVWYLAEKLLNNGCEGSTARLEVSHEGVNLSHLCVSLMSFFNIVANRCSS